MLMVGVREAVVVPWFDTHGGRGVCDTYSFFSWFFSAVSILLLAAAAAVRAAEVTLTGDTEARIHILTAFVLSRLVHIAFGGDGDGGEG